MTIIFDIERSRLSQEQTCLEVAQRQQSRWAIAIINRQIDNLHFDLVEGQLCPTGPAVARHHTVQKHTHTQRHTWLGQCPSASGHIQRIVAAAAADADAAAACCLQIALHSLVSYYSFHWPSSHIFPFSFFFYRQSVSFLHC